MEALNREVKRVWIYTRMRGSPGEQALQKAHLLQTALDSHYSIVGCSQDESDDWMMFRSGLKKALKEARKGTIDGILVSRVTNISHSRTRLVHVLKVLQNHDCVLLASGNQVREALKANGIGESLVTRAFRKKLSVPWV